MAYNLFQTSSDAELYRTYMVDHPGVLFDAIAEYCSSSISNQPSSGFGLAVDLGCGEGSSTLPLTKTFTQVIGVDISESMIDVANSNISPGVNVTFDIGAAEDLECVEDSSVDLVTIGMSLHWMDKERLNSTIRRVLKPGGSVAAYGFRTITLDDSVADNYVNQVYMERIIPASGLPKERALFKSDYVLPFKETTRRKEIIVKKTWSIGRFMDFFRASLSPNKTMLRLYPNTTIYDEISRTLTSIYRDRKLESLGETNPYQRIVMRVDIRRIDVLRPGSHYYIVI